MGPLTSLSKYSGDKHPSLFSALPAKKEKTGFIGPAPVRSGTGRRRRHPD